MADRWHLHSREKRKFHVIYVISLLESKSGVYKCKSKIIKHLGIPYGTHDFGETHCADQCCRRLIFMFPTTRM